jgi:hypothetical protein
LTPLLNDVRYRFLVCHVFLFSWKFSHFLILYFCLSAIFIALEEGNGRHRLPFYRILWWSCSSEG